MNGDGKLDAVYADNGAANVAVALGNGDGTFAAGTDYVVPNNATLMNIAVSDVNGDGKPDVVTTAENATTNPVSATGLYVYLNKGDGIAARRRQPSICQVRLAPWRSAT